MTVELPELCRHRLLFALPKAERDRLVGWSDVVHVRRGLTVHEPGSLIEYIYFPLSAVFSLLGITMEGDSVELCQIGAEGVVGVSNVFHSSSLYQHEMVRTDVHLSGTALRMSARRLLKEFRESSSIHDCFRRFMDILFSNLVTGATCNRHHSLEQRCIRWLLSMQDRTASIDLRMTQENLAEILGVRRQSIDTVLGTLSADRLIECGRGKIAVKDRKELEEKVCECYWISRRRMQNF